MSLKEALARLDLALDRTLELTGRAQVPMGPFTAAFHTPAGMLLRDAEVGEREMFNYVGPKAAKEAKHAAPSVPDQPFFEFNPLQPATPLRASRANALNPTPIDPEVLLESALKLMDGFRPMPRKRKLAVAQLAKVESLRESIALLEQDLAARKTHSSAAEEHAEDPEDEEPSIQELLAQEEAEIRVLERKLLMAKKIHSAPAPTLMSPMRVQMTAPPTPRSAAHRRSLLAPSPKPFSVAAQLFKMPAPSAAQTSAWQTPTITRFLNNSQKGRTPGTLTRPTPLSFGPPSARAREDVGETSIVLEGSQTDMDSGENLLDDTIIDDPDLSGLSGDVDVTILPSATDLQDISTSPLANPRTLVAEEEQAGSLTESTQPAFVEPPLEPIPAVEEEPQPVVPDEPALSDEQTAILTKLWTPFGDILRQSPLASSSADDVLPPKETYDAIQALSALPPPLPPTSITSTTSSSTPQFPPTPQGILLSHVFLRLLDAPDHSLTMSEMKAELAKVPGGEESGVKCIYFAVGKRGLAIKRGGGEARVVFA